MFLGLIYKLVSNLGKLLITELRDKWMQKQGKNASLKEFHDKFLSYGGIPVPLISEDMLAEEEK